MHSGAATAMFLFSQHPAAVQAEPVSLQLHLLLTTKVDVLCCSEPSYGCIVHWMCSINLKDPVAQQLTAAKAIWVSTRLPILICKLMTGCAAAAALTCSSWEVALLRLTEVSYVAYQQYFVERKSGAAG